MIHVLSGKVANVYVKIKRRRAAEIPTRDGPTSQTPP